jgi:hypothetical protein
MAWLSANPTWEAFGSRALMHATYAGADFGDCHATIDRIGEAPDRSAALPSANLRLARQHTRHDPTPDRLNER